MSVQKIHPELNKISKYVSRAEEISRDGNNPDSHLVACCCRQYAIKLGESLAVSADAKADLNAIVEALDANKAAMPEFTKEESYKKCHSFAIDIFDKADGEDRAGVTTKDTAKIFYKAASVLDVLKQFTKEEGGRDEEVAIEEDKKTLYAKWRATEISKASKDGRDLASGGYDSSVDIIGDIDEDGYEEEDETEAVEREEVEKGEKEPMMERVRSQVSRSHSRLSRSPSQIPLPETPMPSMLEEPGTDGQGFEPPLPTANLTQRSRSKDRSNRNLSHASTFDRPLMVPSPLKTVNSMPVDTRKIKSKKPPTFRMPIKSSTVSALPSEDPISNGDASKEAMKQAKKLTKQAIKSLETKCADDAVQKLKEALKVLEQ